jgi:hypothetical protein
MPGLVSRGLSRAGASMPRINPATYFVAGLIAIRLALLAKR